MLFNSYEFFIFLPIVFLLYWFVFNRNLKLQNILIVVASYVFYGWWDWRFLSLIFVSSLADYIIGLKIAENSNARSRKILLCLSLCINLGFLGFFKYFNFFSDSLVNAFAAVGIALHPRTLNIILPVGISFYTFQTLSYTLDIYHEKLSPTDDIVAFFAFVSFFPQLVAGPIERAKNLLPQFFKTRHFEYGKARDGALQILWGLAKKILVADICAANVDYIFANYNVLSGSSLFLGAFFFAFQIYGDFSGYSDVAIGTAKLFGFDLMRNFSVPYFSRDIAEFWRRWHISLSSWFKDYVFIPLGGSRVVLWKRIRNIMITFTVSGLWHGANWTFVFWGALNGLYYLPLMLSKHQRDHKEIVAGGRLFPTFIEVLQILATFFLTLIAWVFFRSESIGKAFLYLKIMFSKTLFSFPLLELRGRGITDSLINGMVAIAVLVFLEWMQRDKEHALQGIQFPPALRWVCYWGLSFLVLFYFGAEKMFIYFQF